MAPVVTTTSIILSSNEIQNGDILVPTNPGPPGKMTAKPDRQSPHTTILFCYWFTRAVLENGS